MPEKINLNEELKFVTILSYGKVTSDDISETMDTLTKLFQEGKINKVLADTTKQVNVPSLFKIYYLSEKLPHGLKIALLANKEQLSFEQVKFFEIT